MRALKADGHAVSVDSGDPGGTASRRAGRRGFPAQPDRSDARRRGEDAGGAGADPGGAWRPRLPAPRGGDGAGARDALPARPDPRPDPFRLHRIAAALRGAARAPAGRRHADGHRQPDRAHRCRHLRRHRGAARHLLGARDRQRAGGAGEPAHAPHGRRARPWPGACCLPRARGGDLPRGYASGLLQVHDRRPFTASADRHRRDTPPPCATAMSASRSPRTACTSSTAGCTRCGRPRSMLFPLLDVAQDGAHAFYLGTELAKAEIAWRLGKRYVQDEPLDWGCAAPRAAARAHAAGRGRAHAAAQERRGAAMIRETIVTTVSAAGDVHVAPFGLTEAAGRLGDRAVRALDDAGEPARGAGAGRELHRRCAHVRGLPDRAARLALRRLGARRPAPPRGGTRACRDGGGRGGGERRAAALSPARRAPRHVRRRSPASTARRRRWWRRRSWSAA